MIRAWDGFADRMSSGLVSLEHEVRIESFVLSSGQMSACRRNQQPRLGAGIMNLQQRGRRRRIADVWNRNVNRRKSGVQRRRCITVESLECRALLTANPIGEQFLVAETFGIESSAPAISVLNDSGDFVAAWGSYEEPEDPFGFGIYAQRFQADGTPLDTEKFLVNVGSTAGDQLAPAVASDGAGNYLIAWQSKDQAAGGFDIFARWFTGGALSDIFPVNSYTTGDQLAPSVAMDSGGNAVIAWQSEGQDGDGFGIYSKKYSLGQTDVVTDAPVNTLTLLDQTSPSVAMASATGQYVIVWEGGSQVSVEPNIEVFGRRFDSAGLPLDTEEFQVNTVTLRDQVTPKAAMDPDGDFAVTWVSEGIPGSGSDVFGQRFAASGTPQLTEFQVNVTTEASQVAPAIGMGPGGELLVTWQSVHLDGFSWGIYGHEYNPDGTSVPGKSEFRINNTVKGPQTVSSVAVHPDGTTLVAWIGNDETHKPAVHAKNYELPGASTPGDVSDLVLANFVALEDTPADAAMDAAGNSVVVWESYGEDGDGQGVFAKVLDPQGNTLVDSFLVNVGMELGNQSHPAVAVSATGEFVIVWQADELTNAGHDIYAQRYDAAGVPVGTAFRVNSTTIGSQTNPVVAMGEDGRFVVVWESPDTDGLGIYAQRYDAQAVPIGGEFQVNSETARDQFAPTVAMNWKGQFVVGWISDHQAVTNPEDDPEKSVFVQWFDTDGTSVGSEVIAHEYVKDAQEHPDVGIDAVGKFVVTWQSINQEGQHGDSWGVYGRQFNSEKVPLTATEFLVNETTSGPQRYSTVGVDADGNFVIAWQSNTHLQDGSSWEAYIRQYDKEGLPLRGEEPVNTWSQGPQINPIVARSTTGNFGVFWSGQGAAHSEGIHGRLYDVNLQVQPTFPTRRPIGDQFVVAEAFALEGSPPDIAVSASGTFVSTWESFEEDGSGWGVYAQRHAADGTPIGDPFPVNSYTAGDQHAPAIAMDDSGNFLIVWQSNLQDGDGYGVYGQWYHSDGTPEGGEFLVNLTTTVGDQLHPDVSMASIDTEPVAVVTWQGADSDGSGIFSKWYTSLGDPTGSDVQLVNTTETGAQSLPSVAIARQSQQFVIVWQGPQAAVEEEASLEIFGQLMQLNPDPDGPLYVPQGNEFIVNSILTHDQTSPSVAMDVDGDFVVAFVAEGQAASGSDVYARRLNNAGVGQGDDFIVNSDTQRPQRSPSVGMNGDGDFLISWQSSFQEPDPYSWGIFAQAYLADGNTLEEEFLVNSLVAGPQTNVAVGMNAHGSTVVAWVGLDIDHHAAIHGKLYTVRSDTAIDLGAPELILAHYLAPEESPPAAGMDAAGNSVVVWQSYFEDGDGLGVFGQRLDVVGQPIGAPFLVNTEFTAGNQGDPAIAVAPDGRFVVTWHSEEQDGDGYGIYAQRFASDGTPLGSHIPVNTVTAGDQLLPSVAIAPDGQFVVVWQGPDADSSGIFARRFLDDGTPIDANEFAVNTETGLAQFGADVAMNAAHDFVVSWVSDHPALTDPLDTEKSVFVQRYDASLTTAGPEVLVHNFVKDAQEYPAVGIDPAGNFVVVWQSINQDGNTWGVLARQFDAAMQPLQANEFIVNETRLGPQRFADVGVDLTGQFVVTWQSISYTQDGSSWDLYAQQYSPTAEPLGHETAVNTWIQGPQIHPVVGQSPGGDFGIYWVGQGTDNTEGVHGRIFRQHDFGDAPDPFTDIPGNYPTLFENDGARHVLLTPLYLGAGVDIEGQGQQGPSADGDDRLGIDDEDGVTFTHPLIPGQSGTFDVFVTDEVGNGGFLDAWIDLNRDGDWSDPNEQFLASVPVVAGVNTFDLAIPGEVSPGSNYIRFRLSSTGGLGPSGLALDGEVEDYLVNVFEQGLYGRKYHDLDQDGIKAPDEPYLDGWTISLYDRFGTLVAQSATTSIDLNGNGVIDPDTETGWYSFSGLPSEVYTIRESLDWGWNNTAPVHDATARLAHDLDVTLGLYTNGHLWEDWGQLGEKWIRALDDGNAWYYVTPDGSLFKWDTVSGPLKDGNPLDGTFIALLDPTYHADVARLYDSQPAPMAYDLDLKLGLYRSGGLYENWGGVGEKWIRAVRDGDQWYYILPDGRLYEWDNVSGPAKNGTPLAGNLITQLDPSYHADPSELYDAHSAPLANEIDQKLGLYATARLYENWGGLGEKWVRAANEGDQWYYIVPDGRLYQWDNVSGPLKNGTPLQGTLVASLDPAYHATPILLVEARAIMTSFTVNVDATTVLDQLDFGNFQNQAAISGRKFNDLNGNQVRDAGESYLNGWSIELVDASGSVVATQVTHDIDADDSHTIDPETETGWYEFQGVATGVYTVREVMYPGWEATTPVLDPVADAAYSLDSLLGLYTNGNFYEDWGTLGEKWLQAANNADQWYYILPDGAFYEWDNVSGIHLNGQPASGSLIETLDPTYHAEPQRLYEAQEPGHVISVETIDAVFADQDFGNRLLE